MEWADELIHRLISLWGEGHSTAEIGRRINVTKNAVVGKAHRLKLPPRPSPIRRDGAPSTPRPATPRRIVGSTLPPLPATLPLPAETPRPTALPPGLAADLAQPVQPRDDTTTAAKPAPVRQVLARSGRLSACCWPIGEPGTKTFRFCDGEAMPAKPYCAEHAQIAYVKVRDRREEAA